MQLDVQQVREADSLEWCSERFLRPDLAREQHLSPLFGPPLQQVPARSLAEDAGQAREGSLAVREQWQILRRYLQAECKTLGASAQPRLVDEDHELGGSQKSKSDPALHRAHTHRSARGGALMLKPRHCKQSFTGFVLDSGKRTIYNLYIYIIHIYIYVYMYTIV